jgi:hypothetical protein
LVLPSKGITGTSFLSVKIARRIPSVNITTKTPTQAYIKTNKAEVNQK